MPTFHQRPGRRAPLPVALVLAGAVVLAGCIPGPPSAPPSAPLVPSPAAPSDTDLCGPKPCGAEQPPDAGEKFDGTLEQVQVIGRRLVRVMCRGGLWNKGVGFGVNCPQGGTFCFVMVHPGFSGLTPRQILDRLLGV